MTRDTTRYNKHWGVSRMGALVWTIRVAGALLALAVRIWWPLLAVNLLVTLTVLTGHWKLAFGVLVLSLVVYVGVLMGLAERGKA